MDVVLLLVIGPRIGFLVAECAQHVVGVVVDVFYGCVYGGELGVQFGVVDLDWYH